MCEKCDAALLTAANAALMLASAAEKLYGINQQTEATTLAKAAAELFELVEDEAKPGDTGTASASTGEAGVPEDAKQPRAFFIDEDGTVFINGVAMGRVVVLKSPTKH